MSAFGRQLEKKITGKINAVANGELEVKDAGINNLIKTLKSIDEAAAETLQKKYIETVKGLPKKN